MTSLRTQASSLFAVELSPAQLAQFERLTALLLEWNGRMSLTAIAEPSQIERLHYLDSLSLAQVESQWRGQRLIDVGTGAGFPGLALAIAFPQLRLTLLDSTAKKLRFVDAAADELGLGNVRTLHARAEDAGRQAPHRESYDIVVARAVTRLPTLIEYCLPLAEPGGKVIAMKGASAFDETAQAANAITRLGGELFSIDEVQLPGLDKPRYLVVIDKIEPTPRRFPRRAGIPSRQPIL